ncbi:MAG: hypothetical protein ACW99U_18100 [Candidatus Thorarchaeota archaeon]|jgi:hypothetical protein
MNETHSTTEDTDVWFAILLVLTGIALVFIMAMILNGVYFGWPGHNLGLPFVAFTWLFLIFSVGLMLWGVRTLLVLRTE